MQRSLLRLTLVVGLAVALGAAACGEEDQPIGAYLNVLDVAEDDSKSALDEAFAGYNAAVTEAQTDDEVVAAFRLVLGDIGLITEQYYNRIRSVVPPPEVDKLHNDAVRAQADVVALLLDIRNRADLAASSSDVGELLTELNSGQEFLAARDRLQEAFCAIQAIGIARGADAEDIGCDR